MGNKLWELQYVLICPSTEDLGDTIENDMICNNALIPCDIGNIKHIFGPNVPSQKWKTVMRKSKLSQEYEPFDIPPLV